MSDSRGSEWLDPDWASRLEQVRKSAGIQSLREFHGRLTVDGESPFSYDAIRTYHLRGREPPVPYLALVAKRFDVRLEWLVTGEQPVMQGEVATEERGGPRWLLGFPWMENMPPVVRAALMDHLSERDAARWRQGKGELSEDQREKDARKIWDQILEPIDGTPLDWPGFKEYALAAIHALNLALRIETTEEES